MARLALLLVTAFSSGSAAVQTDQSRRKKPHLIYVLADDFGYYDVSWRNPAAHTPNLDSLRNSGVELKRFYTYKYCSPTRSSFLSGRLPVHVNEDNNPTSKPGGVDVRMTAISQKLKALNYATTTSGKWHGGGHLDGQLPINKGFDTSLVYLNGNEDHYSRYFGGLKGYDLWQDDANKKDDYGENGTYGEFLFVQHAVDAIEAFDPSKNDALFMYMAFQNTHTPQQVPEHYKNASIAEAKDKRTHYGMASALDEGLGNITQALLSKRMWDDTLLVFSADNGGELTAAGNNFPLRGGKYTDFEGGTRTVAFVSGGWLPKEVRGQSSEELIHICDMWSTFASLAGDPEPQRDATAEAFGDKVPVPDSVDVSDVFRRVGGKSGRSEVPLSQTALIVGDHKIVTEGTGNKNIWTTADWPAFDVNSSASPKEAGFACKPYCIFDLSTDTEERHDLAGKKEVEDVEAKLVARLGEIKASAFSSADADFKGNHTNCISQEELMNATGGFVGPLCYAGRAPGQPGQLVV